MHSLETIRKINLSNKIEHTDEKLNKSETFEAISETIEYVENAIDFNKHVQSQLKKIKTYLDRIRFSGKL
jgi:hypothetical protein